MWGKLSLGTAALAGLAVFVYGELGKLPAICSTIPSWVLGLATFVLVFLALRLLWKLFLVSILAAVALVFLGYIHIGGL
jgi:hypothetical protein